MFGSKFCVYVDMASNFTYDLLYDWLRKIRVENSSMTARAKMSKAQLKQRVYEAAVAWYAQYEIRDQPIAYWRKQNALIKACAADAAARKGKVASE